MVGNAKRLVLRLVLLAGTIADISAFSIRPPSSYARDAGLAAWSRSAGVELPRPGSSILDRAPWDPASSQAHVALTSMALFGRGKGLSLFGGGSKKDKGSADNKEETKKCPYCAEILPNKAAFLAHIAQGDCNITVSHPRIHAYTQALHGCKPTHALESDPK